MINKITMILFNYIYIYIFIHIYIYIYIYIYNTIKWRLKLG